MIRVFWDTNLFIYLVEDYGALSARVVDLLDRTVQRRAQIYTSAMTLGEVLVWPWKVGSQELAAAYEAALSAPTVRLIPFDEASARTYAHVRQDRSIDPPDAIQLACAAQVHCDLFITNDDRLSRKNVPGIQFIVPLDRAFL